MRTFRPLKTSAVAWLAAPIAASLLLSACAKGITVRVNGQLLPLPKGATARSAVARFPGSAQLKGDLVSVKGTVITTGAGGPPVVSLGGEPLPPPTALKNGQELTISRGADVREPIVRRVRVLDSPLEVSGRGAFLVTVQPGHPGKEVVESGKISGSLATLTVEVAPQSQVLEWRSPRPGKVVALTFDDGPNPTWTPKVLAILSRYRAKATFFEVGYFARSYPKIVLEVSAAGHQLGDHSYYHWNWNRVSSAQISQEIRWTRDMIVRAGAPKPTWLRPPGGVVNQKVYDMARKLGFSMVLWTADTEDWRKPAPKVIAARALAGAAPGAVILMHDGGGDRSRTVAALPAILAGLKKKGYSFVTVEQLFSLSR
jgi:peptidoglycan-N-acetylglucosamine deacetylase